MFDEELKELKEQLEAAQKAESGDDIEEIDDPIEVEEVEEPVAETPVEEPVEQPPVEEPKLDDAGYARLRREKKAAEKRAEEAEARLAKQSEQVETPEPVERQSLPPEVEAIIERERINQAGQEFTQLEETFRQRNPDYDDVSNAYKAAMINANRLQNPRMPKDKILELTNKQLLQKAGTLLVNGFDPIEEMYHEAKELGFKAQPKPAPIEEKKEIKPDLAKVAANKARNAGTAGLKGEGAGGTITASHAADMNAMEWAKLPKSEKDRILNSLRG